MQPLAVAEDLDVVGDGEPRMGPAGEGLPVIHLVLQRAEEAFGGGVVPAHPGPPGAGADAVGLAEPGELSGGILLPCRWNAAPGWAWPWLMAIARASVTRLVHICEASCQPVTIRVARSITVARYSQPSPVLR